ncbi:helix-turn-helix domain-containing protein [Geodermatophilus nigrescens]
MADPQSPQAALPAEQILLTPEEAAQVLRIGRTTLYALMRTGELRPVHIGRSCRLSRAELQRYVRGLEAPRPVPARRPARPRPPADQLALLDIDPPPPDAA